MRSDRRGTAVIFPSPVLTSPGRNTGSRAADVDVGHEISIFCAEVAAVYQRLIMQHQRQVNYRASGPAGWNIWEPDAARHARLGVQRYHQVKWLMDPVPHCGVGGDAAQEPTLHDFFLFFFLHLLREKKIKQCVSMLISLTAFKSQNAASELSQERLHICADEERR